MTMMSMLGMSDNLLKKLLGSCLSECTFVCVFVFLAVRLSLRLSYWCMYAKKESLLFCSRRSDWHDAAALH